jgi:hypothetical protein
VRENAPDEQTQKPAALVSSVLRHTTAPRAEGAPASI